MAAQPNRIRRPETEAQEEQGRKAVCEREGQTAQKSIVRYVTATQELNHQASACIARHQDWAA